jgi:hypothetical protein
MTKKLNIPFSPPDITEEEIQAVTEVMRSGWITTGPKTKQFEKEIAAYCHTQKAVCMNSATACLEMTLRLFGIGEGDEVIVPAYTYTASASVVCHVGATLKLVDCAPGSFHLDYDALEQAVTEKTKAIYVPSYEMARFFEGIFHVYSIDRGLRKDYCPQDHHFLISAEELTWRKGDPLLCGCGYADQLVALL